MHIATDSLPWCCQAATGAPSSWGGQPNAGPIAKFEWSYARKIPINVHVGERNLAAGLTAGALHRWIGHRLGHGAGSHRGCDREERLVPRRSSEQAIRESVTFGCPPRSGDPGHGWTVGRSDVWLDSPLMYQLHSVGSVASRRFQCCSS